MKKRAWTGKPSTTMATLQGLQNQMGQRHTNTKRTNYAQEPPEKEQWPLGTLKASHTETHGFRGDWAWEAPRCVLRDSNLARSGYTTINRDEFEDTPDVLAAKIKMLTGMVQEAKFPIAYTGAGISTASGIPDYATGSEQSRAALILKAVSAIDATPSDAHLVLARLHAAGLMKVWVQQNHDGLPQKAGFPQACMNEIHGAWFDPSNPVVKMSGSLRDDLFESMLEIEEAADFCLCVGTSLSGMNADRVAVTPGTKAQRQFEKAATRSGQPAGNVRPGLVIINLQRTQHDDVAALRIFAKASVVLGMLAQELRLPVVDSAAREAEVDAVIAARAGVFAFPYSAKDGSKLKHGEDGFVLDLRDGARVRVASGKYAGNDAHVTGRTRQGHFRLAVRVSSDGKDKVKVKSTAAITLGKWWVLEGMRGDLNYFPLVPYEQAPSAA